MFAGVVKQWVGGAGDNASRFKKVKASNARTADQISGACDTLYLTGLTTFEGQIAVKTYLAAVHACLQSQISKIRINALFDASVGGLVCVVYSWRSGALFHAGNTDLRREGAIGTIKDANTHSRNSRGI